MPSQPSPSKIITELPPIVAEHIAAVNAFDIDRIVNTFSAAGNGDLTIFYDPGSAPQQGYSQISM